MTTHVKLDSRRLSVAAYRRTLGGGLRLWTALLLKFLRVAMDFRVAYPLVVRLREIHEERLPQGAMTRLQGGVAGLQASGLEMSGYLAPELVSPISTSYEALLASTDATVVAIVSDIETEAQGRLHRHTSIALASALEGGGWIVTTSNGAALDAPAAVEQTLLPQASTAALLAAHQRSIVDRPVAAADSPQELVRALSQHTLDHNVSCGKMVPVSAAELEALQNPPAEPARRRHWSLGSPLRALTWWVVIFVVVLLLWSLFSPQGGDFGADFGAVPDLADDPEAQAAACGGVEEPAALAESAWLQVSARLADADHAAALHDDLQLYFDHHEEFGIPAPWQQDDLSERSGDDPLGEVVRKRRRTFVAFEQARYRNDVDTGSGCLEGLLSLFGRFPDVEKQGREAGRRQRELLEQLVATQPDLDARLVDAHVRWVEAEYSGGDEWVAASDEWRELLGGVANDALEAPGEVPVGFAARDQELLSISLWGVRPGSSELQGLVGSLCAGGAEQVFLLGE